MNEAIKAKEKYERILKDCTEYERAFFDGPVKEHMMIRFEKDCEFCRLFLQRSRTYQKCIEYLIRRAEAYAPESAKGVMVKGSLYLKWMEEYIRNGGKRKFGRKKPVTGNKPVDESTDKIAEEQSKADNDDIEGQMDIFDFIGRQ